MKTSPRAAVLIAGLMFVAVAAPGQFPGFEAATIEPSPTLEVKAGEELEVPVSIRVRYGYHINSNRPNDDYLIPTRLTWDDGPLKAVAVKFPEAETVKYNFSEKPLSVYSGQIVITTKFDAPQSKPALKELTGKLRYQACNDKACLPPKTAAISIPLK